ncbi:MAG: hypothetical protein HOP08_00810 [Cyclobacteriaceae bacterium]|nr:hypothetical protein [Cyclobacteriaceae bacterium]
MSEGDELGNEFRAIDVYTFARVVVAGILDPYLDDTVVIFKDFQEKPFVKIIEF